MHGHAYWVGSAWFKSFNEQWSAPQFTRRPGRAAAGRGARAQSPQSAGPHPGARRIGCVPQQSWSASIP